LNGQWCGNRAQILFGRCGSFVEPVVVIPDIGGAANEYFVVKNRDAWKQDFEEWLETSNRDSAFTMSDDESSDEEYEALPPKTRMAEQKREEQDAKTKVGLNLTRNFRPATRRQWRPMQSCLGDE
jgi:hypothetical protein